MEKKENIVEKEINKKSNIGLIIVIVLLSILVVMFGYYFVSNEFLNKNNNGEVENGDVVSSDTGSEKQEIEYKFDASKIVNKNPSHEYSLATEGQYAYNGKYEKTSNGYKFCSTNYCRELVGEFTIVVSAIVAKGGPGMGDGYYFLVSNDGTLYYANETSLDDVITGVITQVKDVVKLYVIELSDGGGEYFSGGSTVVAQTKDGLLYDLFEYVRPY